MGEFIETTISMVAIMANSCSCAVVLPCNPASSKPVNLRHEITTQAHSTTCWRQYSPQAVARCHSCWASKTPLPTCRIACFPTVQLHDRSGAPIKQALCLESFLLTPVYRGDLRQRGRRNHRSRPVRVSSGPFCFLFCKRDWAC